MAQWPLEAVPAELFCATGRTVAPVPAHEEFLLQQHEAGAIRIHDRGWYSAPGCSLRRWRISWSRGEEPVHTALAFDEESGILHAVAHCAAGWSLHSASPLIRAGFAGDCLRDTGARTPLTGSVNAGDQLSLPVLIELLRRSEHAAPLLIQHLGSGQARWVPEYRKATIGCASVVLLDDAEAELLARELAADRRVPERGARLFLPQQCHDEPADVEIPERLLESESEWHEAVDVTLRAACRVAPDSWPSLLSEAGNDERVAGSPGDRWPADPAGDGKPKLRQRIHALAEEGEELRRQLADGERALTATGREVEQCRRELASLDGSRETLVGAVLRLRAERDVAQQELAGTSVGVALARKRAAQRLARRRSEELQERAAELSRLRREAAWLGVTPGEPPAAGELDRLRGLRLAEGMAAELSELDPETLRRCLVVLERLSAHAETRSGSAAEYLRSAGVSALLLGRAGGTAVTFPVPPAIDRSGWSEFPDYVRTDHSGYPGFVVHYLDDTAGPTGVVHIGYVGPPVFEVAG